LFFPPFFILCPLPLPPPQKKGEKEHFKIFIINDLASRLCASDNCL
jgi:hypothetical protein